MDLQLHLLNYKFKNKPLLIGGKAKEYYKIRKAGIDTDLIVTIKDYEGLKNSYPNNLVDLWGDLGIKVKGFEIWKTICLYGYDFLEEKSLEMKDYKIITLEKLLFLTALGIKKSKYQTDLKLIVKKIFSLQYKDFDSSKYK